MFVATTTRAVLTTITRMHITCIHIVYNLLFKIGYKVKISGINYTYGNVTSYYAKICKR